MPPQRDPMSGCDGYSLVIGRFQPLHEGHMDVIRKCASECEHLIIGIGSAQYSHAPDNPFTAGERYLMIDRSLRAEGIDRYSIVPIEDLNRCSVWVAHVVSMVPPFKRVYTNNPLTKRLFNEAGFDVEDSPLYNRSEYSGTEIRRRMIHGEDWKELVPAPVADIIEDIDGVNRLRSIAHGGMHAGPKCRRSDRIAPQREGHDSRSRIMHRRTPGCRPDFCPGIVRGLPGFGRHVQQQIQDLGPRGR